MMQVQGRLALSAAVSADQITFILSDPFISSYLIAPSITEPGRYNGDFCILFSHNSRVHRRRVGRLQVSFVLPTVGREAVNSVASLVRGESSNCHRRWKKFCLPSLTRKRGDHAKHRMENALSGDARYPGMTAR